VRRSLGCYSSAVLLMLMQFVMYSDFSKEAFSSAPVPVLPYPPKGAQWMTVIESSESY
jgi:hypothetical protein